MDFNVLDLMQPTVAGVSISSAIIIGSVVVAGILIVGAIILIVRAIKKNKK